MNENLGLYAIEKFSDVRFTQTASIWVCGFNTSPYNNGVLSRLRIHPNAPIRPHSTFQRESGAEKGKEEVVWIQKPVQCL